MKKKLKKTTEESEEKKQINILDEYSYRLMNLNYQKASAEALQRIAIAEEKRNEILKEDSVEDDEEEDDEEEDDEE